MGARGPLPSHLKVAGGTDDAQPQETAATKVKPLAPDKPAGLTAAMSKQWDQAVQTLEDAGLIAACDGPTLELALRHHQQAVQAHKKLMRQGPNIYDAKNKRWAKNPASQVMRDHSAMFIEYVKLLGMAFAARARITLPEAGDGASQGGNPFAAPGA